MSIKNANRTTDEIMDYAQTATLMRVKIPTLYQWVRSKGFPYIKINRRTVRFRRSDIDAWLASKTVTT